MLAFLAGYLRVLIMGEIKWGKWACIFVVEDAKNKCAGKFQY